MARLWEKLLLDVGGLHLDLGRAGCIQLVERLTGLRQHGVEPHHVVVVVVVHRGGAAAHGLHWRLVGGLADGEVGWVDGLQIEGVVLVHGHGSQVGPDVEERGGGVGDGDRQLQDTRRVPVHGGDVGRGLGRTLAPRTLEGSLERDVVEDLEGVELWVFVEPAPRGG